MALRVTVKTAGSVPSSAALLSVAAISSTGAGSSLSAIMAVACLDAPRRALLGFESVRTTDSSGSSSVSSTGVTVNAAALTLSGSIKRPLTGSHDAPLVVSNVTS